MSTRINYNKHASKSVEALMALENAIAASGIDPHLKDLIKLRASQLNGCLFCMDMHSKEALKHEERILRLIHLPGWRESSLFTEKEKAALEWTELLTKIGAHGAEDEDFKKISAHFSEKEVVDLTMAIAAINAWNRLGVAFRSEPGGLDKVFGLDKLGLS